GDAGRTTNDTGRSRPVGGFEEGEEEADHAGRGCRGVGGEHSAGEASVEGVEEARGQGGDPRVAGQGVEPADRRRYRERGGEDLVGGGLRRVWTDAGCGVFVQAPRH